MTSAHILKGIKWAVDELGVNHLDFTSKEIGLHSIRLGAALSMSLNHVKTYTSMLQGRWCSDAFLMYTRKQVKDISDSVSAKMVSSETSSFFTIPDCTHDHDENNPITANNQQSLTVPYNGNSALYAFIRYHIHD